MTKQIFLSSLFTLLIGFNAIGQTTQEARELLQKASAELQSHAQIYLEFEYNFENNRVDPPVRQHETGNIGIMGDSYHLRFLGTEQIRDGNTLYTILPEDEEVQITDYEEGESASLTPTSILKSYEKGYSYKLGGTEKVGDKTIKYVVLKPNASEEIDKIMVGILAASHQLYSLKQWGTNGTITTFLISRYQTDKKLPTSYFKFDKSNYADYYIVD